MIQIDIYYRNYGNGLLMTAERYKYAVFNMMDITLRKRLHIFTFLHMKKMTDDNFKKNELFSNETFIIQISFLSLLGDLE